MRRVALAALLAGSSLAFATSSLAAEATTFRFAFGAGKVPPGYAQVLPTTAYTKDRGYGFDLGSTVSCVDRGGFCTSDKPFFFSVDVPEGNYRVAVTLGDPSGESTTTVKAESRRLMLERVKTARGKVERRTFTVNVRNRRLASGGEVRLNDRELGVLHWDDKLTLEFSDTRPCLAAIEITKVEDAVTVYLAGDSTVTDQTREPWASWGQMLPRFFTANVAIANHAESGETLKAFLGQRRLEKLLSTIKAGDYLFIQFAHNDQKEGPNHLDPFTTYKDHLKLYIGEARKRGAIPVLVTPVNRRTFDEEGKVANSLGDYPEAMRQAAKEEKVALIDLFAMTKTLYEALGAETSKKAFVHIAAGTFPSQEKALRDDSHFSTYGAYEIAKCVIEGIRSSKLEIAKYVVEDLPAFDPARPDPVSTFALPLSPTGPFAPQGR